MIRMFLSALVFLFVPHVAYAASVTAVAGTGENITGAGDETWVNASNIQANDGTYATVTIEGHHSADSTRYLRGTSYGFTIPTNATINGIVVSIDKYFVNVNASVDPKDLQVQLVVDGNITGDDKSAGATLNENSERTDTYGGSSDTWGLTPTPTQINASNFGVVYRAEVDGSSDNEKNLFVDDITVTVYYTEAVPDLHEWAMIILIIGGVYFLYREGMLDGIMYDT